MQDSCSSHFNEGSSRRLRIKLLGDHSNYHSGCQAVIQYLRKTLASAGNFTNGEDYDILIVNGEGSMHHNRPDFLKKMKALQRAIFRSKTACLVNTVWQSNSTRFDHVLKSLRAISVREQLSHDDLLRRHNIRPLIRLDTSYWAEIDESASSRNFDFQIVVGDYYSRRRKDFAPIMFRNSEKYPRAGLKKMSWSSIVKGLRTASLLVTGRHHGVFAACRARIPFVAIRGNTHKIEGLIKTSGLRIPVCDDPSGIEAAIEWAFHNRATYERLFLWMDGQPRLGPADLGQTEA
jgi:hypothetical protein